MALLTWMGVVVVLAGVQAIISSRLACISSPNAREFLAPRMGQTQLAGLLLTSACVKFDNEPINQLKWPSPESTWEGIAQICGDEGVRSTGGTIPIRTYHVCSTAASFLYRKARFTWKDLRANPLRRRITVRSLQTQSRNITFLQTYQCRKNTVYVLRYYPNYKIKPL